MIGEEDPYVHLDLRELLAHLLGGGHHTPALVAAWEAGLVERHPRREAGNVEVVLLYIGDVLQGFAPRHVAVGSELPRRLVDVDVAVDDEDVLEPLLAFFLPRYGLRHVFSFPDLATIITPLYVSILGSGPKLCWAYCFRSDSLLINLIHRDISLVGLRSKINSHHGNEGQPDHVQGNRPVAARPGEQPRGDERCYAARERRRYLVGDREPAVTDAGVEELDEVGRLRGEHCVHAPGVGQDDGQPDQDRRLGVEQPEEGEGEQSQER